MKQTTLIAIAAALTAIAAELESTSAEPTEPNEPTAPEQPRRGRGRPASTPATSTTEPTAPAGPTDAERLESNKELIKPLVQNGQGEDVKKVIAKYSKTGLKDVPAASQADFAKDIEALSY